MPFWMHLNVGFLFAVAVYGLIALYAHLVGRCCGDCGHCRKRVKHLPEDYVDVTVECLKGHGWRVDSGLFCRDQTDRPAWL